MGAIEGSPRNTQPDLSRIFKDAQGRVDRSLGVPAHAIKTQIARRATALYEAGAIQPIQAFSDGELRQVQIIPIGLVSLESGFFGFIDTDGIIKFCPQKPVDGNYFLNLDDSFEPHEEPDLDANRYNRTILGIERQSTDALNEILETFQKKQRAGSIVNDDTDEGREIRLEIGI